MTEIAMTLTQCTRFFQQSQEVKLIKAHYGLAGGELKKPLNRKELAFKLEIKRDIFMIKVRVSFHVGDPLSERTRSMIRIESN